jgi:outer membrane protein TolC
LQNFSNLRAMRTVTPGRIGSVTEQELQASLRESRAGIEAARRTQEEATAQIEAARAELEKLMPRWEKDRAEFREWLRESGQKTDLIIAELKEHRDERRALLEAIFRVLDRLD